MRAHNGDQPPKGDGGAVCGERQVLAA